MRKELHIPLKYVLAGAVALALALCVISSGALAVNESNIIPYVLQQNY